MPLLGSCSISSSLAELERSSSHSPHALAPSLTPPSSLPFLLAPHRTPPDTSNHKLPLSTLQGIREHFNSLPSRYAYDVNIESLDVLNHKKLLDAARSDPATISFSVRPVNILLPAMGQPISDFNQASPLSPDERTLLGAEVRGREPAATNHPAGAAFQPKPPFKPQITSLSTTL